MSELLLDSEKKKYTKTDTKDKFQTGISIIVLIGLIVLTLFLYGKFVIKK